VVPADTLVVLVVSKAQCWGCSDIGMAIRRWKRAEGRASRIVFASPQEDAADVCRFVATEKLHLPVYGFNPSSDASRLSNRKLVLFAFIANVAQWDTASNAVVLLESRTRRLFAR
jgi:hypothetical protein